MHHVHSRLAMLSLDVDAFRGFCLGKRVNRCCMGNVYVWVSDQLLYGKSVVVACFYMYVAFCMVAGWSECKAILGLLLLGLSSLSCWRGLCGVD